MTGDLEISNSAPKIILTDTDNNSDFHIVNANGQFNIKDRTNSVNRFTIESDGDVGIGTTSITSGYKLEVNGKVKASNGKLSTVKYTDASTSTTTEVDSIEFELDGSTLTITTT